METAKKLFFLLRKAEIAILPGYFFQDEGAYTFQDGGLYDFN